MQPFHIDLTVSFRSYNEMICAAQDHFIRLHLHRDMLIEAFRGLEHLETIDLRDFNAWRSRDQTSWHSWGSQSVLQETGREPSLSRGPHYVRDLFSTLLYSLGIAGRKILRLETPLRDYEAYLQDKAFCVTDALFPVLNHVLRNLEVLHLAVSMTCGGFYTSHWLRHFLNCTPNLKHLRLNFTRDKGEEDGVFLEWLAAESDPARLPPHPYRAAIAGPSPVELSRLVTLELGQLDIHPKDLLAVIKKFGPKLEQITLRWIGLRRDQTLNLDEDNRSWTQFFEELASISLPSLKGFSLTNPSILYYAWMRRIPLDDRGVSRTWSYVDQDSSSVFFHTLGEKLLYKPSKAKRTGPTADSDNGSDHESDYESNTKSDDSSIPMYYG